VTDIVFRSDMTVELIDHMGDDRRVVRAARVSTGTDELPEIPAKEFASTKGLIKYLMENRHGSPFEKGVFEFRIECPIFAAREFMRHRVASYNETSGRYRELDPVFWIPASSRPLQQSGKPGAYDMRPGTQGQWERQVRRNKNAAEIAYGLYQDALADGICREVARTSLGLSIYTSFYVTINARSLMNFLSLRIDDPANTFITKPQHEIEQVARQMQVYFAERMPVTWAAFDANGRVAP